MGESINRNWLELKRLTPMHAVNHAYPINRNWLELKLLQ